MSEVRVRGLAELQRALDTLPARMEANIMRGAIRVGSRVIAEEARRLVPVGGPSAENERLYGGRPGLLRDSIRVTSARTRNGRVTAMIVAGGKVKGSSTGDAYYARFVELGTAPHIINAPPGARLNVRGLFLRSVMHPGARKQPFLRPALDGQAQAAVQAMAEYIRKRLAVKHGLDVPAPEAEDSTPA